MNWITHFKGFDGIMISRYDYFLFGVRSYLYRLKDNIPMWIANILPKKVILWCYIKVMAKVTACEKCGGMRKLVDNVTYSEAHKCWEHCKD